jgi:hypothetical protein
MASSITTSSIDATFPVAGQDNDSQGFRDNFSQIKTQFDTANTEITSLQANRAATNASTSFNGHDVTQINLRDWHQRVNALGTVSGAQSIDLNDGNVVTLTTSGATTISFTNWPKEDDGTTNTYATVKFILTKGTGSDTITLTGVTLPMDISGDDSTAFSFPARKSVFVFECFSADGGSNIYMSNPQEYDASS